MENPEIAALKSDKSDAGLKILKQRYLGLLFDLPGNERLQIESAGTQKELQKVMTWVLAQGTQIRFRVRTIFQQKENSDSDTKDDRSGPDTAKFIDVWNESGDCGIPFQKGETYLVYATDDEQSDHLETSVCRRTIRLTDAGDDLAYLYFVQSGGAEANRLEGFVTSEIEQLQQDRFHYTGKVKSPVSSVVIELKSANGTRYTETDPEGRFVFDGLADGEYSASVFEAGFPDRVKILSGPKRVDLRKGKCATTALLVLVRGANR